MKCSARIFSLLLATSALVATPVLAAEVEAISNVEGFNITTTLKSLPAAPGDQGDVEFCEHLLIEPTSAGGKIADEQGWGVTGEVELGDLTLVSFVGGYEAGTRGSCLLLDGNVGFFKGSDFVALAFGPAAGETTIGRVAAFGDTGARIWDGDYLSSPAADITIGAAGEIALDPLATQEAFCGGKAVVPAIYDTPIGEARDLLKAAGWTPVTAEAPEGAGGYREDLVQAGITEVNDCAGTGFGYCSFSYQSTAGTLSVTTVGDPQLPDTPSVSAYNVACRTSVH